MTSCPFCRNLKIYDDFLKTRYHALLLMLAVIEPGLITAMVDNDAGGITTYSVAGAHFGYSMLWVVIPMVFVLIVVQEMCSRMGVVSGKGLSDLIRESYGAKVTFYLLIGLLLANILTIISEFSGVAGSLRSLECQDMFQCPLRQ